MDNVDNVLHNIGDPQSPKRFRRWHALLVFVEENEVTGYGVDSNGEVVNFRKGKRRGASGKWNPAAGGVRKTW